ncbi:hypothetical protein CDV36_012769 [Fusarium kuroshium]|uniref:Uncharacterized protein n=1 Tax=Fusarium kuroshium TaxID=2010991 RepID=A0A3M2RQN0_9HYPO|nr:hypothetical protein CDV36_012769 [Fusarium kuroshium]
MTQLHDKEKAMLEVHGPLALVSNERIGSLVEERPSKLRHHRHRSDAGKLQHAEKETRLALDDFSARRGTEQDGDIVHRGLLPRDGQACPRAAAIDPDSSVSIHPSIHPFVDTPIPQSNPSASFSVETALVRLAAEDFQKVSSPVILTCDTQHSLS